MIQEVEKEVVVVEKHQVETTELLQLPSNLPPQNGQPECIVQEQQVAQESVKFIEEHDELAPA